MLQERQLGSPVYSQNLGLIDAEVYATDAGYQVFIAGETLTSYLGSSLLLDDCLEEIRSLQLLVESESTAELDAGARSDRFPRIYQGDQVLYLAIFLIYPLDSATKQ